MRLLNILIAEDDANLAMLWQRAFIAAGYSVYHTYTGTAAVEYLEKGLLPRVVLVDQLMPGLSGTDVLERLSQMANGDGVTTILITASPEVLPLDVDKRADIILQKPVSYRDLVALANRLSG